LLHDWPVAVTRSTDISGTLPFDWLTRPIGPASFVSFDA
jgi:hypothetical protein